MADRTHGLRHELLLLPFLAVEVVVFAVCGQNFLTATNGFEIVRVSVEVGLLALALTLVIVAGGIDLSVGSTMGLVAVALGWLCLGRGWPIGLAVPAVLLLGALAGGLNGWLVSRLGLPPLIVTLGTWSLYRGLAEGVTHGIVNYTGFPAGFLALGQGYWWGRVPQQLPLFVAVAIGFALLLHATVYGRTLYAVGHSPAGARHAGVPVARRVAASYVLSGLTAALAGVIYVARVGQAKADAGTNYELLAITAVVLGGTSIFGGRGTIGGTLLGLYAIVLLENGLRLAGQPAELAGILTGALLLAAIAAPTAWRALTSKERTVDGELDMKNSQVVWLSVVMLLCAMIVAGSNFVVASHLKALEAGLPAERPVPAPAPGPAAAPLPPSAKRYVVAMMPKSKGDPYFVSCREGAEAAAKEVGVDLLWDGPTETDAAKQNEVVETWITKGVDCIAVSVQNPEAIATVLRKARAKGMPVLTWDADALPDA
ncbi:MAG: substrate-binding domain-containing protein, partial [Armatimonadetes bacterium]|nr:substrate-binding domain-containing protein [Armatimonadota bacterium]